MKTCPSCSQHNATDAAFCIRCGFPLANVTADAGTEDGAPIAAGYLAKGAIIDGKYSIVRILGEGGMGVVYLARDVHTDTPVVVKSIRAEFADNPEFRARTLAEGRALARIDHANVVRLNAVVVEPTALYLIMQFIEGEPLDRMIQRHIQERNPISLAMAVRIFRMILAGVGAAHDEGVIHRDLKPANILIRAKDGVAKVTDFGIAKGEEDAKAGRGPTKGIIGSVSYMAPEQIRGQRDLDKRVDIYALGIVLFEMLTGRVPFDAPSDYEVMKLHTEAPVPPISANRPDVPGSFDEVVFRACAKDRERRFATTEDFAGAVNQALQRAAVSLPPHPHVGPGGTIAAPMSFRPPEAPFVSAPTQPGPSIPPGVARSGPSGTGEGASLPAEPDGVPHRARGWFWWSLGGGIALLGGALLFATGTLSTGTGDDGKPQASASSQGPVTSVPAFVDAAPAPAPPVEASAAPAPLTRLAGKWKSSTQRDYEAVPSNDGALEFRIRSAAQHPRQGYVDGEVRFKLIPQGATLNDFAVEDHIRPVPPPGLEYSSASRDTCLGSWTTADGKKLQAHYDGAGALTVDLVQITTSAGKFKASRGAIDECADLAGSPAHRIESRLTRSE